MRNFLLSALLIAPVLLLAQDYIMYETIYITPKQGENKALERELAEHNQKYHAEAPYSVVVFSINTGSHSGDYFWAMGPCTYSDLDDRPADEHDVDWGSSVMAHGTMNTVEYWIMDEELTYDPDVGDELRTLQRVRFFDVADTDLFRKTQGQIRAVIADMGGKASRVMYRNRVMNREGRDWAIVSEYKNWTELDEDQPDFRETFEKLHGADSWDTFEIEFDKAVISREDEWREMRMELNGAQDN
jgi:hypothetical protein